MAFNRIESVLFFVLALGSSNAFAQSFSGPYAGVDVSRQHLIGGSLVDGVDMLQEDSRLVTSLVGGLRGQFGGVVVGGELGFGRIDGNLHLAASHVTVDYRADSQRHWALTAGHVAGTKTLLFAYVSEVTRQFDVTVRVAGQEIGQEDEQGMLRFGGGLEYRLRRRLHLRATAGTSRADFGGRPTNITIGRRFEAGAGLVIQF